MRLLTLVISLCCVVLVLGLHVGARGEDEETPAEGPDIADLERQIEALETKSEILEKQVQYLLARDAALTAYALDAEKRGAALQALVRTMRSQGFANRAIPAPSRESLLAGLDAFGRALQEGLPRVTREQDALLKAAARVR